MYYKFEQITKDDACPTSVLDAMAGGAPALVSNQTGSIDMIKNLDKRLISPLDIDMIVKKILLYIDLDTESKEKLSKKSMEIASKFDKVKIVRKFREDLLKILSY